MLALQRLVLISIHNFSFGRCDVIDVRCGALAVNVESLDEQLRAALGSKVAGLSTTKGEVIVHLESSVKADEVMARSVVAAHNPNSLSRVQEDALAWETERAKFAVVWEFDKITLGQLAQRVRWLEQEIIRLIGPVG
jgi:hypothetical protein